MNIIRETKWALLELFPGQKDNEAAAEEAAWKAALAAEAEEEVETEETVTGGEEKVAAEQEGDEPGAELGEEAPAPADADSSEPEEPAEYDPEVHDVPLSIPPEGERPDGVMIMDYPARGVHIDIQCSPDQVVETAEILDAAGFHLESIAGVDWIKAEQMEVIYDYTRTDGQFCRVVVRSRISRSEPEIPTISTVFPGANWHERETHEFFGITFTGHPYLVPLLLPEDADFHPLLKDFTP